MVVGVDIKKLISNNVFFVDSRTDSLIQSVDVLASFTRRTLTGELRDARVTSSLGALQIRRKRGDKLQSVRVLSLSPSASVKSLSASTLMQLATCGRAMIK